MTAPVQALVSCYGRIADIYRSNRGIRARCAFTLFFSAALTLCSALLLSALWELHILDLGGSGYSVLGLMLFASPVALLLGFLLAPRSVLDCCEKLLRR